MRKLALISSACALVAATFTGTAATADPGDCANPCTIEVVVFQYVPPVASIATGTEVRWTTDLASHPTTDSLDPEVQCFQVPVGGNVRPVPVRFDVAGGIVRATTAPGTAEETTAPCGGAVSIAAGRYALHFGCVLHPYMHGVLLIQD